jgi:hypothetical protein
MTAGQPAENPADHSFYAQARAPKALWHVPGSRHLGGVDARPREYERRVVAFFDENLLKGKQPASTQVAGFRSPR